MGLDLFPHFETSRYLLCCSSYVELFPVHRAVTSDSTRELRESQRVVLSQESILLNATSTQDMIAEEPPHLYVSLFDLAVELGRIL